MHAVGEPEPAKIIHSPDNYSMIVANETFTTSCHGYGIELPVITWQKSGTQLTNDDHVNISESYVYQNNTYQFTKSVLTINSVGLMDVGNYSCLARNNNGTDVHQFVLEVIAPG